MAPEHEQHGSRIRSIREVGQRALMVECRGLADVMAYHQRLSAEPLDGQVDVVAAAATILLVFDARGAARRAAAHLDELVVGEFSPRDRQEITVDVVYDGEDLGSVAESLGVSPEALVEWHTEQAWTGAFTGFAPGFTYCVPEGQARSVPRRDSPRTTVPRGSVGLAGEFSAVYPQESPGGWQLIGRTTAPMWDLNRDSPALIRPGDTVRYVPVRAESVLSSSGDEVAATEPQPTEPQSEPLQSAPPQLTDPGRAEPALTVTAVGVQALVQDRGRSGLSDLGVSGSGAVDDCAARQANRLLGNSADAAVLEVLYGGLQLRAERTVTLVVTGAETALIAHAEDQSQRTVALRMPFVLTPGETLALGTPSRGIRSVLGARGGIAAQPVLGSRATDTLSGVGPEALRVDDVLALDRPSLDAVAASPEPSTLPETEDGTTVLCFTLGPRDLWFDDVEVARLSDQLWAVTQDSNRVGLRLEPDPDDPDARPLKRSHHEELPSEGMVRGALQVPPAGSPVLFLNDHPVTGGYPVIGVVIDADLSAAAQLGPGERIRFRALERETADGSIAAPATSERGSPASDRFSAPQDSRRKGRP